MMKTATAFCKSILKKVFVTLAVSGLALLPAQGMLLAIASAAGTGTWVDGDFPQLTVGDIGSPVADQCFDTQFTIRYYLTSNGFYLPGGRDVTSTVCAKSSIFGLISNTGYLNTGGKYSYKTANATGTAAGLSVDQNTGIAYYEQPTPSFGPSTFMAWPDSIHFNTKAEQNPAGYDEIMRMDPLSFMKDNAGNLLFKMPPKAFSSNGKWFVFYDSGTGLIRANLETHQLLLFDTQTYNYDLGFHPSVELAISDDGNTVLRSGVGNFPTSTKVYDLSGCQNTSFTHGISTNTTTGCRSRLLQDDLATKNAGFVGMTKMVFTADGKAVRAVADILKPNNVHEYRNVTYAVAGEQVPDVKYLAIGDSFSSGEGVYSYIPGTDVHDINLCHTSELNYASLAASALNINGPTFHNDACSGARSINYFAVPQYDQTQDFVWTPGEESQKAYVSEAHPGVVTISMIGNDIGFKDKIINCLNPFNTCYQYKEDRQAIADEIYAHFDTLVAMYENIQRRAEGSKVYVLGYPQILSANAACEPNAPFNANEVQMARGLVTYLNAVIKAATQYSGVQYIDVENAFVSNGQDYELCGTSGILGPILTPGTRAVNGITLGDDIGGVVGNESFHPNQLGHQLMSQALIAQSQSFTLPMPTLPGTVDTSVTIPYVGSAPYNNFIGSAPSNGQGYKVGTYVNLESDGQSVNIILQNSPTHISDTELKLQPNSTFNAEMHSTPVPVGTVSTDANGHLSGTITVPSTVTPGFHMLHLFGNDIGGKAVDLYKAVYVAASANDLNGDGIPNSQEKCPGLQAANVDVDRDGIDDACDPQVTAPPADSTPPNVVGTPDRAANANGWYNNDVTINWTATDPDPSSGAPTQPAATLANQEGDHTYTSGQSCDPANNCATGSLGLKIDKTAPDITFSVSPAPNASGWNNGAVTVTFTCTDATSGVASCTDPQTVSGPDGTYVVTGSVTDNAGNTNAVNAFVSIDSTKPVVTQALSSSPNADGWYNTDVTVTPTCTDNLSGILSCSSPVTLSTEGAGQTITSDASDNAGNTASTAASVNIDKTAPTLGTALWDNNPKSVFGTATITVPASDNLSGITAAEYYLGDTDPGQGNGATMQVNDGTVSVGFGTDFPTGVFKVTVRAKDKAGNWSTPVSDYLVVYDPFGTHITGHSKVLPLLANSDILPGLIATDQTDQARFGFNVLYDDTGNIDPDSDFQFKYDTGTKCTKPTQAVNCHSLDLNANSIAWLFTTGTNNSTGVFQGTASLKVDGTTTPVLFRVTGLDGQKLDTTSADHLTIQIFNATDNPNTATPIYYVNDDVLRGNISVRTW